MRIKVLHLDGEHVQTNVWLAEYLIRHRNFEWWSKYNFLLSAGLDAGTVFSGILIFLTLQLPKGGNICAHTFSAHPLFLN